MSGTPVHIELHTETAVVGESVRGHLLAGADVGEGVHNEATVELLWRTSGLGDAEEQVVADQQVHMEGSPEAPFALDVPAAGPMSYAGQTFSINWFVRIAGRQDTERPLTVTAAVRRAEETEVP